MRLRILLATVTATLAAATVPAAADTAAGTGSAAHACSSAVGIQGFSDALDKTTYGNTFVGNLSALSVDRDKGMAGLSDRSSLFTLDPGTLKPTSVVNLADEKGAALDSEGLVADRDGTWLVSSETEPSVRRYSRDGRILDRLPVPDALGVAPAGRAVSNQTFEGLTLLPGGRTLLAGMEGSLSGDAPGIVRFQTWTRQGKHFALAAQYGYLKDPGLGVAETTATPDGRLLVLERGFTAGYGNTIRLYLADLRHATDTRGIDTLTGRDGVRLARKTLLADLVNCPALGAQAKQPQPNPLLDNIEGMTVTGASHGRLNLLLVSDDNQSTAQITRLYSLRVRLPHPATR
ncbi:esterase-like activity of phytase family protein [Streptomyces glomeratus]|uniref:Esterase-like activity of phytase family protein n=1 Tax=Streptomyces glomeratus TaxID=284452 RepID=A0ABP6M355_9ACTN|nr:esterase-like activity of phytase family protein [Streptomyces glomeratus]MCF1508850.1 esterase-like activity of phytase family protein [Streptomyces glomeratus]